ncbi:MAG TPA: riboflavin synthase [Bacteroidota bacterium]|nr:riboflavin synthase [Bacteroidota bacterium]
MFTGIVQEIGTVVGSVRTGKNIALTVRAEKTARHLKPGSSIAVNGTCLTAVETGTDSFTAEIVEESLRKTAMASQLERKYLNLELPLRADGLIDGHLVLGHVDTTGVITSIEDRGESWWFSVRIPGEFLRFIVHTGSIAIDGVSLTVAGLEGDVCRISIIPHTMKNTIFQYYRLSERVNIEVDVIGKYVERMMRGEKGQAEIQPHHTIGSLRDQGF